MLEHLKKLLSAKANTQPRPLPAERLDEVPLDDQGVVISVNLDNLGKGDQKEFRQAVSGKSELAFYEGHVEHGYSLDCVADPERCPRCHAPTERCYANFVYATHVAARVLLAPAGYFCTRCPTVIVDEAIIRGGVTRGYQFCGVAGVDYEGQKPPDFLQTWNGERTIFILDEDENLVEVTTHGAVDRSALSPPATSYKQAERARERRRLAKQSRKRNRRKR